MNIDIMFYILNLKKKNVYRNIYIRKLAILSNGKVAQSLQFLRMHHDFLSEEILFASISS